MTPTRADVVAAAARIRRHVHRTPVLTSRTINALLGAEFHFKCENLQRMGAFKIRGATNAVRLLPDTVETVATHSSGNHGAALALAAAEAGLRAIIVVPSDARESKRCAIERYGAEVVTSKPTLAGREATLKRVVADTAAAFVPPYDHADIIAGAGTCAMELLEQRPGLDQLWVPVGGGGLAAGTVLAVGDEAQVILGEPELAADARQSLSSGVLQGAMPPVSVADGLRTALGTLNFAILRTAGVTVHLASEAAIEAWVARLSAILKVVVEPSAAVTLAAMAENAGVARGRVGVILSGGNV